MWFRFKKINKNPGPGLLLLLQRLYKKWKCNCDLHVQCHRWTPSHTGHETCLYLLQGGPPPPSLQPAHCSDINTLNAWIYRLCFLSVKLNPLSAPPQCELHVSGCVKERQVHISHRAISTCSDKYQGWRPVCFFSFLMIHPFYALWTE